MKKQKSKSILFLAIFVGLAVIILSIINYTTRHAQNKAYTSTSFAMDTVITQTAYGPKAETAMAEVNRALIEFEQRLSLFDNGSEIAAINESAGKGGVEVSAYTAGLLRRSIELSTQHEDAFAITIAPLTLAWGITTNEPRIVPQLEIERLLQLVDDTLIQIENNTVALPYEEMGIDLGGIAKGEACAVAAEIYDAYNIESALLWIGGNTYARGTKPDGTPWRIGFRDPENGSSSYIAAFDLTDSTIAVSGGYERYFEADGETFIHIIDPCTGYPVQSDIVSVGVIHEDGATADFYSTVLFVQGRDKALQFMREGGTALLLDDTGVLYASESLRDSLTLYNEQGRYELVFVEGG